MWLLAVNRVGVPLLLAGVTYMVAQTLTLDRRVSLIERDLDSMTPRIVRLEGLREADMQRAQQLHQELTNVLTGLRSDIAGIRADQGAMLRSLTRLEGVSDRNVTPAPGGPR
jgi:hypothetical protein